MNCCPAILSAALLVSASLRAADVPVTPVPPEQSLQQLAQQTKDLLALPVTVTNRPVWQQTLTLGLTMARGNQDSSLATGKFLAQRKSATNEFSLGLDGAYGENNTIKNYETLHGFGQANHFFTRHAFAFGRIDGLHDGIKDIDYRFTVSPGVGQGSVDETYAAWRVAERFEYKLNATTRLWQGAEFIPQVDKPENYIVNADLGIEVAITKKMGLQIYLQDNFVSQPVAGYKNNDLRLVSGVSFKF